MEDKRKQRRSGEIDFIPPFSYFGKASPVSRFRLQKDFACTEIGSKPHQLTSLFYWKMKWQIHGDFARSRGDFEILF